jgi:hypothetical protein
MGMNLHINSEGKDGPVKNMGRKALVQHTAYSNLFESMLGRSGSLSALTTTMGASTILVSPRTSCAQARPLASFIVASTSTTGISRDAWPTSYQTIFYTSPACAWSPHVICQLFSQIRQKSRRELLVVEQHS